MHKTFAHISSAQAAEIGLPVLFTLVEAHEETWEASTTESQAAYVTTFEHQSGGVDRRIIAGREYVTEAGAFSVFAAGTRVESEEIQPGQPTRVEYLRLSGSFAAAIERTLEIVPDQPLILTAASPRLALGLADAIRVVFQRRHNWPWLLMEAVSDLTRAIDESRRKTPVRSVRLVDRVRTLVEESPHHPWSVKELAALLKVRREVMWEQFHSQTGQSPGDWIRQHRIRVAQALLDRGLSVRETASRMGFSSRQQFARTYRNITGRAPSLHHGVT